MRQGFKNFKALETLTAIFIIIFGVSSKIFSGIPITIFNDEPIMKNC